MKIRKGMTSRECFEYDDIVQYKGAQTDPTNKMK
jgi:hypothetical protein